MIRTYITQEVKKGLRVKMHARGGSANKSFDGIEGFIEKYSPEDIWVRLPKPPKSYESIQQPVSFNFMSGWAYEIISNEWDI